MAFVACAGAATAAVPYERAGGGLPDVERGTDIIRMASLDYYLVGSSFQFVPPYLNAAMGQRWSSSGVLISETSIDSPWNDVAFGIQEYFDGLSDDRIWAIHTSDFSGDSHELALVRVDDTDGIVWAKRYPGQAYGYAGEGGAIRRIADVGFVVACSVESTTTNFVSDGNLLRIDPDGNVVFHKGYSFANQNTYAVDFTDVAYHAPSDEFVVVGSLTQVDGDPIVPSDVLVARLDSSGAVLWAKTFDFASPDWTEGEQSYDRGVGLTIRLDGNIVVASLGDIGNGGNSATCLLLLSPTGSLLNSLAVRDFQAANSAVKFTWNDDDVVVGGSYGFGDGGSMASMMLVDSSLNLKWRHTYADTSRGEAVLFLDDDVNHRLLLAGGITNYNSGIGAQTYLVETLYDGITGCEGSWNDPIPFIVTSTDVTLTSHNQPAPLPWQPSLVEIAATDSDVCSPLPPCPADFNGDGFIDFTDFDDFVTAFENGDASSDFNGDGFLDFTDFDDFVAAFEAGC
jgi:hypothetical protein